MVMLYDNPDCINEYFCEGCLNILPEEDFYPKILTRCKECHKERRKEHYQNNKLKTFESISNWNKKNPEKCKQYQAKSFKKNKKKYQR